MYRPNTQIIREFTTSGASGAAVNADSLPTGTLAKNGVDDVAVTVTVVNIDTGRYKATCLIPINYLAGDTISLTINATVASISAKSVILNDVIDRGIDFTQLVPTTNTAQSVGDALNAARAQGFGKWTFIGTSLSLYAADNTTIIKTFTLDSSTAPTQRV